MGEKDLPANRVRSCRCFGGRLGAITFGIATSVLFAAVFWSVGLTIEGSLRQMAAWISSLEIGGDHRKQFAVARATADVGRPEMADQQLADSSIARLLATSPGRNPNEGTAELISSGHTARTYTAGALLATGARLTQIYSDRIVLSLAGDSATVRVGESFAPANSSRERSNEAGKVALSHEPLTEILRPSPVFDTDGELLGYRILPGRDAAAFGQSGLRPGDVIVAVDRIPLQEALAIEQLRQLTRIQGIVATVQRDGRIEEIAINSGSEHS